MADKKGEMELQPLTSPSKEKGEELPELDEKELESSLTGPLVTAVFTCAMGSSFQFGYNIGVVNTPEAAVRKWINQSHNATYGEELTADENTFIWSVAVSAFALGGMFGGLSCGLVADKLGRKGGMLANNLIGFLAAALMGLSKYANLYYMFILGRLVVGVNSGLNSGLAPMYLVEVSPINYRGAIGSINQLVVTISILVSQILGIFLGNETWWPLAFALTAAPALFQCIFLPFCPESPRYNLIIKNLEEQAEKDLIKLRGKPNVHVEMEGMRREVAAIKAEPAVRVIDMVRAPLLWPIVIAVMMMFSQQFSGINVAMYYSTNIFESAGLKGYMAKVATLLMGLLNVCMTFVSVVLVDRFGRRVLHLTGMTGMVFSSTGIVIFMTLQKGGAEWAGYVCVVMVLLFVVSFATGPGSIPWFFVSELFRQNARGHANSIAVMTNWLANFCVGLFFLPLQRVLFQFSFFLFTGLLILFIIFTYLFVPETKGKSINYIVKRFEDKKYLTFRGT